PTVTNTPTGTALATSTSTPTFMPCPMPFTDVHPDDYFYDGVRWLYCRGAISGYNDNTFRPFNNTIRGQMCKIIVLGYGFPLYCPPTSTFRDVQPTDPFYCYIETAAHLNLISGYNCGGPGQPCPRLCFRPCPVLTTCA